MSETKFRMDPERVARLTGLISFMMWLYREQPNAMWGGVSIADAIDGITAMTGLPENRLHDIAFAHLRKSP